MKPSTNSSLFVYSVFRNVKAQAPPDRRELQFTAFVKQLEHPEEYAEKAMMPLLVAAEFSGERTAKGAYRADGLIVAVHGVCGDHDAGTMSVAEAAKRLRKAGVEAVLYTSPSHTEEHPRWRVVAPFKATGDRHTHKASVERLNHVLDGALTSESFALSQSYYFGHKAGALYRTVYIKGRRRLDECREIERRPWRTALKGNGGNGEDHAGQWAHSIVAGEELHPSCLRLAGRLVSMGTPRASIRPIMAALIEKTERDPERVAVMLKPGGELDRMIEGAYAKGYAPPEVGKVIPELGPPPEKAKPVRKAKGLPKSFMVGDLLTMKIPATQWLVDGLIAPGLTLLAAPAKQGKSYLALQMLMCVADGKPFLNRPTRRTRVTYFDLEEWHALLKERVVPISKGNGIELDGLPLAIRLETGVGQEAFDDIESEIRAGSKLVVVDLLARIRDEMAEDARKNAYARDYSVIAAMADFALRYPHVAIVVVHHGNKAAHDEWVNKISGSMGVAGAAHTVMYMARPDKRGMSDEDKEEAEKYRVLHAVGKMVKGQDITIQMMERDAGWQVSDLKPWEISTTRKQKDILLVLHQRAPDAVTSKEMAELLGLKPLNVKQIMYRMAKSGVIVSEGRGGDGFRARVGGV